MPVSERKRKFQVSKRKRWFQVSGRKSPFQVSGFRAQAPVSGFKFQDCPSGESAHVRDNSNKLGSPLAQSQTSGHRELLIKAFREILQNPKIDFDQLILYPSFIHVSYVSREKNRHGILLGRRDGKLGYGRITLSNALKIE